MSFVVSERTWFGGVLNPRLLHLCMRTTDSKGAVFDLLGVKVVAAV